MIKKVVRENYKFLLILVVLTLIFFTIGKTSVYNLIQEIDYKVIEIMLNIHNETTESIMKIFTFLGECYIPILIIVCMFLTFKNKLYSIILATGYASSALITLILKNIIMRPRPLAALIDIPSSYSFPSGHTLTGIFFYILLWYLLTYKKSNKVKILTFIPFTIIGLLIGFSRIYLGVHYFSDVMGGIIYVIPCLACVYYIINNNFKEKL